MLYMHPFKKKVFVGSLTHFFLISYSEYENSYFSLL